MATTQELITALTGSRNTIRTKLVDFGLVPGTAKLGDCATAVDGIANNGAVDISVQEGESYTIPKGYHNGAGVVKGVAGGGNYTLQPKTVTPTKSQQSITPDQGYYGLSGVTVKAIPDNFQDVSSVTATAADVLATKTFVDANGDTVSGAMVNNGAVSKTLDATTGNQSYSIPAGYHNGNGKVTVVLEEKSVTPSTASQNITPTAGKVLSKVTVGAIPAAYGDATDKTATAAGLLEGETAISWDDENKKAVAITGTMPNNGALGTTLDATNDKQSYTIPAGYTSGGTVSITLEEKTSTPTTSEQVVTPAAGKVISKVTIAPIPAQYGDATGKTVTAAGLLQGETALGWDAESETAVSVTGTMANNGTLNSTLDATKDKQSFAIPAGYTSGGAVSITLEEKSATPTTSEQSVTPTTGKVLSKVTVAAIPAIFGDATGADAVAANILLGKKAIVKVNNAATMVEGTMADNGAITGSIDGLTTTSYTIPAGYTTGGTVSLTNDINEALAAI